MSKFVAYYRVSTKQQGKSGLGLKAQQELVMNYLKRNGIDDEPESYTEVESGGNGERPELTKAVQRCKEKGATLLIAKLDRLSRNVKFIFALKEELEAAGVKFEALDLPEVSNNTMALGMVATFAQHELERIKQRTRDGIRQSPVYKAGKWGNPENFTDEYRAKAHRIISQNARQDPETRKAFEFIRYRREHKGMSYRAIADELNKEGYRTRRGKEFFPAQVQKIYLRFTEDNEPYKEKPNEPQMERTKEYPLKVFKEAATELNEHMGLEPPIETDNADKAYLIQKIAKAQQMIEPADEFSDQTEQVLQAIRGEMVRISKEEQEQ